MLVQSLGQEDPLEEETATYSSILAWKIPWTEEPGEWATLTEESVACACSVMSVSLQTYEMDITEHAHATDYTFYNKKA